MGFLSSHRRKPEPPTLAGVRCPSCGGGLYIHRA